MQNALKWCVDHWAITVFALTCFIQITPIFKANPITALFKWIGKVITADVTESIKVLDKKVEANQKAIDENEKDRIRFEVLDFANSCRNECKHSKDEFEHVIVLNEKYERLLEKTNDSNGVFTAEYNYIYDIYRKCQEKNNFL